MAVAVFAEGGIARFHFIGGVVVGVEAFAGEDVVDLSTGEIIAEADQKIDMELAVKLQDSGVPFIWVKGEERNIKVLSNRMVDLSKYADFDLHEMGIKESVYYPVLEKLLGEYTDAEELKEAIEREISELIPKHITKDDIMASINYNMHLSLIHI